MRTLDDVYGPDLDDFPLEQDASPMNIALNWSEVPPDYEDAHEFGQALARGTLYWGPGGATPANLHS